MRVRAAQMSAMSLVPETEFERQLASLLRDHFEDAADIENGALVSMIRRMARKAQRYRLYSQAAVAMFVTTAWIMGEDFDSAFEATASELQSGHTQECKAFWLEQWIAQYLAALEHDGALAARSGA